MADIRLRRPTSISFHRRAPRALDDRQVERLAAFWSEAKARQPRLFDGPTVEARQVEWHRGHCRISWSETSYARYLWRRALPAAGADVAYARALYTSVLVTTADGYVVVGQMNDHTSSAGRIQLPGGTLDAAERDVRPVTVADAAAVAVRELHEEMGITVDPADVRPWMIVEGGPHDDVAVIFELTPELSVDQVFAAFSSHLAASARPGEPGEFERLVAFPLGGRRLPARLASDVTGVPRADVLDPALEAAGVEAGATICRAWPADPPTTTSRRAALAERGRSLVTREPREQRDPREPRERKPEQQPAGGPSGRSDG